MSSPFLAEIKNIDVVELQRQRITLLEEKLLEQSKEMSKLIDTVANLSRAISEITDAEYSDELIVLIHQEYQRHRILKN